MELNIKLYVDYLCPFCFLTKFSFSEAVKNKNVKIEYIPFQIPELDLNNDPFRKKMWNNILKDISMNFGHEAKIPDIPNPKSKLAFEAYYFADDHGKGNEFHNKVYEAFFEKGKDIGNIHVLSEIANEIGLDSDDIEQALKNRSYKDKEEKEFKKGKENNIDRIPTVIIGETRVIGYKSKEFFQEVIEEEYQKLNLQSI